ncbi:hypothetical protein LCGC14_2233620 [marine sediment metagenome]|uniref:Uncharacterized protein n=1 Tax=marine sediment metagenome TaxID=412755 RepID=A0A0F9FK12_9ZZZZ
MTNNYDNIIKHLGHPLMIDARGSSGGGKPRAWIKCMRCDEVIIMTVEPKVAITYEMNERRHDETSNV